MQRAPTLTGDGVVLRPPLPRDIDARLGLGRSPEIMRMFGASRAETSPLTRAEVQTWMDQISASPTAWVIACDGHFLGDIRLRDLDMVDRRARLGIGLYDPARLGQGIGRAAIRLLLRHAFCDLGLHRLSLRVLAFNLRAIACYRACGFVEEGRERESALVDKVWCDDIIMGCLENEARY